MLHDPSPPGLNNGLDDIGDRPDATNLPAPQQIVETKIDGLHKL